MYITLPSGASQDIFPNNTIGRYKIKLPGELHFDKSQYEVGLTGLEWPHSFQNITRTTMKIQPLDSNGDPMPSPIRLSFSAGYYNTAQELASEMNIAIRKVSSGRQHCFFEVAEPSGRVSFRVSDGSPVPGFAIKVSWRVYCKLGFSLVRVPGFTIKTGTEAPHLPDVNAGLSTLFVYSDIIESQRLVGPMLSPLLRILPIHGKRGEIVHFEPRHIEYFDLKHDRISEVMIECRSDSGDLLHFTAGKVVATLHIRRKGL